MSMRHNQLSHGMGALLLQQLRAGGAGAGWASGFLTTSTTKWAGMKHEWPQPDQAFQDKTNDVSLAVEFKPPNHAKGEYVRGLGQCLTYLNDFTYAALVVASVADDGMSIGDYLRATIALPELDNAPIAVFVYDRDPADPADLRPIRNLKARTGALPPLRTKRNGVFWAYWRDLSAHDLFWLLRYMDRYSKRFDEAYKAFWTQALMKGKALTWEGKPRKKKKKKKPVPGDQTNARQSMVHIGAIDSDGRITAEGYELLRIGKVYDHSSVAFRNELARMVLGTGRHLELILWVDDQQKELGRTSLNTSEKFRKALDKKLIKKGVISPPSGSSKANFLRDEPKLWNKLGLLKAASGQTFTKGRGFLFDWGAIVSLVGQ